jgi:hypothetical protein
MGEARRLQAVTKRNENIESQRGRGAQNQDSEHSDKQAQYIRWLSDSFKASDEYRGDVVKMMKALGGDPWPDEVKSQLDAQNRPHLSINKMLAKIMLVSGIQRRTRQEPVLIPSESTDAEAATVMNHLLHWVEQTKNAGPFVDSSVFLDKIGVGLGWWKYYVDFDTDLEGVIRMKRRHPLAIFPDPYWLDEGWEAANFVADGEWLTRQQAKARYGNLNDDVDALLKSDWTAGFPDLAGVTSAKVGDSLGEQSLWFDPQTKRVREVEMWYKTRVNVTVAAMRDLQSGQVDYIEDPEKVKLLKERIGELHPDVQESITFIRRTVPRVQVARLLGGRLLEDEASPYDCQEFPIFPALGYYFWKQPQGMAQLMYDLQLTANKQRSLVYELVSKMALSGWLNKKVGGAEPEDLINYANGVEVQIPYETEPPIQIRAPGLPVGVVHLDKQSTADMAEVINVNAEMSGLATQRTISGRAVEMRQRGGVITQEMLFDTFVLEKKRAVRFTIELIKQYVSPARALRILGTQTPEQQQDETLQTLMSDMEQVQAALGRAFETDYDVDITQKPYEPSMKIAMWETLTDLAQKFGPGSIPPDILADAAVDAGIITKDVGTRLKAHYNEQKQAAQAAAGGGGPPGMPPPGGPGGPPPMPMPAGPPPPGPPAG